MKRTALLDVNVLIALLWYPHTDHEKAQNWFKRHSAQGWATCPLTESSFVRIVGNPAFSRDAVPVEEAVKLLAEGCAHPQHQFWPDDISYKDAVDPFVSRVVGHQQVTDSYLLGLAIHRNATLVTMDKGIWELLPEKMRNQDLVTVL